MKRAALVAISTVAALTIGACNNDTTTPLVDNSDASLARSDERNNETVSTRNAEEDARSTGFVFILSNQTTSNAVLKYNRNADGSLTPAGSTTTDGRGTGAGLGSQGALAYSPDGNLLFVVNAGSNTVTSFRVRSGVLTRSATFSSGGIKPISVTAANGVLYVLNAGGTGNITGLRYYENGILASLPNSTRPLSSNASDPAEIAFTADGAHLIVTEKGTNLIGYYNVGSNGLASAGQFRAASGITPFGFAVYGNDIIVSEAFGGASDASAVSSYRVGQTGLPATLSGSVPTTETSACWIAITSTGKFAFAANTGSGTVSTYNHNPNGTLSLIPSDGVSASIGAGSAPADLGVSRNNRFLYVRNGGNRTISAIRIFDDGSLSVLGTTLNLPAGTSGLVAN